MTPELEARINNFMGGKSSFLPEKPPATPLSPPMDIGQSIDDISQSLSEFAPYGSGKTVDYMVTNSATVPNQENIMQVFRAVAKQVGLPAQNMQEAKEIFDYEVRQGGLNFATEQLVKRFGQMSQSENTLAQDPRDYRVSSMSEMASGTEPFTPESGVLYRGPEDAPTNQEMIDRFEAEMARRGRNTGQGSVATGARVLSQNFQEGGEVEQMMMMAEGDPNAELAAAINGLMVEQAMTDDPEEQAMFASMSENIMGAANAPLSAEAQMIAAEGRGRDTTLAHLTPGEVVLPVAAMQDSAFETAVENRFNEIGLDPEQYVVGAGIASLNPVTGLEEFGAFKKVGKFLKKAVKVVAPIAALIPGVGTAVGAALGGIGGLAAKIPVIGETLGNIGSTVAGGIAGLGIPGVSPIAGGALEGSSDFTGTLMGGLRNPLAGGVFGGRGSTYAGADQGDILNRIFRPGLPELEVSGVDNEGNPLGELTQKQKIQMALNKGYNEVDIATYGPDALLAENQQDGNFLTRFIGGTPGSQTPLQEFMDDKLGFDPGGGGVYRALGLGKKEDGSGGILDLLGLGGQGDLGKLALGGGAAYMLGKLAMDEAKKDKGVPKTPLTMMDSSGRYNIAAEVARQQGRAAPNPVEYGLLPRGTLPELSGGSRTPAGPAVVSQYYDPDMPQYDPAQIEQIPVRGAANGGAIYPMAYANGGNVAMEDFERMNGGISGPGTETSDDVPAMLSDGEFVMTGQAVRGAGSFDMSQGQDGILTLTPSGAPDRQKGTDVMYAMMNMFEGVA
jgi:hypothetical protein